MTGQGIRSDAMSTRFPTNRPLKLSGAMIRVMTFSGLIAALVLAAVLVTASSQAGRVQAAEDTGNCRIVEVAADEGYGISETVSRRVCQ